MGKGEAESLAYVTMTQGPMIFMLYMYLPQKTKARTKNYMYFIYMG